MTNTASRITALDAALQELQERAEKAIDRLERKAEETVRRLARGTLEGIQVAPRATPVLHVTPRTPVSHSSPRARRDTVPDARKPQQALMAEIRALLATRPRTYAELRELTGTHHPHTANALIQMQRDGEKLANIGTPRRAIWSLARK